jgi:3-oxoacyl-[acyl-carrier protein] reductase
MISADLTGKAALVTGAASGIGLATAEAFARCGAAVAINHLPDDPRGPREVERLKRLGHRVVDAPGDVSQPGQAERMVTAAIDALGRLDFLANNAGTPATPRPIPFSDLEALTESFWSTILSTNLIGPFRCAHAAVPALKLARGAICNTASIAGVMGSGSSIPYATSKAGLINLTRSLARTLAPEIRVNAVGAGARRQPVAEGLARGPQACGGRADAAEACLHAGGHCRDDLFSVRRWGDDHRADGNRRRWSDLVKGSPVFPLQFPCISAAYSPAIPLPGTSLPESNPLNFWRNCRRHHLRRANFPVSREIYHTGGD